MTYQFILSIPHGIHFALLFFLVLLPLPCVQSSPSPDHYNLTQGHLFSSVTLTMLVLILAFIVTGCLGIYIRNCSAIYHNRGRRDHHHLLPISTISESRKLSKGLDRSEIEALPTFIYSEVKQLKVEKAALECAVCLGEFEEHESLRVLPKCDHVFHPSCIDPWLTSRTTCPVCRADILPPAKFHSDNPSQSITIQSDGALTEDDEPELESRNCVCENHIPTAEFKLPAAEWPGKSTDDQLVCDGNEKWSSGTWNWKLSRSNSTGHSTVVRIDGDHVYSDRLTVEERRRIMEHISRTKAFAALPLLPCDRNGFRSGTGEGDWSDNRLCSLLSRCTESNTPVRIGGCDSVEVDVEGQAAHGCVGNEQ